MLNYSNTHRKDPKTKSNAFWCAVTLATIFTTFFVLINYYETIFSGIEYIMVSVWSGISIVFISIVNFLKPVLEVAGNYIFAVFAFAWLWSICVFNKTETTCFQSIIEWRNIGVILTTSLLIYVTIYLGYFVINVEKIPDYVRLCTVMYLLGIVAYIDLIGKTQEIINPDKNQ